MVVAIDADYRSLRQNCPISRPQLGSKVRCYIDVDQPGDTVPAEQSPTTLRSPDDAAGDHRAGFNLFVGPDLNPRLNDGILIHHRMVADHGTLKHHRLALDAGGSAYQCATELGALPDVGI